MKNFFNRPFEFSFKDFLAILFVATFLYATFRAIHIKQALEVVKTLIPIISIVLGGYFGQEMVTAYFQSRNPYQQNGYYGGYISYPPVQTAEEQQQSQSNNSPTI